MDAINEEAKQMEKLANKRSLLLKKVTPTCIVHMCIPVFTERLVGVSSPTDRLFSTFIAESGEYA